MVKRNILFVIVAMLVWGCSPNSDKSEKIVEVKPPKAELEKLSITGPGGKLTLGDTVNQAKKAFPAPAKAEICETSLSFAILGQKGWAWRTADNTQSFEVLLREDKVAAVGLAYMKNQDVAIKSVETQWGKPTHRTDGKAGYAESWVTGDSARMVVLATLPNIGKLGFVMIGSKSDLKSLAYDADDPAVYIQKLDEATKTAKDLEPAFREAKRKAMEKAKQGK